jgi:predicted DCC family thiol-disulfide oxidoreductase YuxK
MDAKSIILFDGVCNLCNGFVNFLIDRDRKNRFQFGSLQSEHVKELLQPLHYSANELSTVLLLQDNQLYSRSTAVLKIFRQMPGPWPLLYTFIILPRPLRDYFYDLVARHRYRMFGKRDACRVPTPELKAKFVG